MFYAVRALPGHWESQPAVFDKLVDENTAWVDCRLRGGQKDEKKTFCMFVVAAVLSVFFSLLHFQLRNRIKNYGIFFFCKLPPLIKYATDKVKKEFLSCTNDRVFVFWLWGEKRFPRTAETSVKINSDRDNEKFNIETAGIYISATQLTSSGKDSWSLHHPCSAKTKLFLVPGAVVWGIKLTNGGWSMLCGFYENCKK